MVEKKQNKHVLLVEDHPDIVKMYRIIFETKLDAEIHVATNAHDAYILAKEIIPDLILLDLMIPNIEGERFDSVMRYGFEVLKKIKSNESLLMASIVILTNLETEADRKKANEYDVDAYMVKSKILPGEVTRKLQDILR